MDVRRKISNHRRLKDYVIRDVQKKRCQLQTYENKFKTVTSGKQVIHAAQKREQNLGCVSVTPREKILNRETRCLGRKL